MFKTVNWTELVCLHTLYSRLFSVLLTYTATDCHRHKHLT